MARDSYTEARELAQACLDRPARFTVLTTREAVLLCKAVLSQPPGPSERIDDAFSRLATLIHDIEIDRYGKPLRAALALCNDLADENADLRHDLERAMANHNADINSTPATPRGNE